MPFFSEKSFLIQLHLYYFITLIIQAIAVESISSTYQKGTNEVLELANEVEDSLQSFIELFSQDYTSNSTRADTFEKLNSKNQKKIEEIEKGLSEKNKKRLEDLKNSYQGLKSSFNFNFKSETFTKQEPTKISSDKSSIIGKSSFKKAPNCRVETSDLQDLKNKINIILLNKTEPSTSTKVNCIYSEKNPNNCQELVKLIKCGVHHINTGFLNAMEQEPTLELMYWKDMYERLTEESQSHLDRMKKYLTVEHQQKLQDMEGKLQELQNSFNYKIEKLKTTEKKCEDLQDRYDNLSEELSKTKLESKTHEKRASNSDEYQRQRKELCYAFCGKHV